MGKRRSPRGSSAHQPTLPGMEELDESSPSTRSPPTAVGPSAESPVPLGEAANPTDKATPPTENALPLAALPPSGFPEDLPDANPDTASPKPKKFHQADPAPQSSADRQPRVEPVSDPVERDPPGDPSSTQGSLGQMNPTQVSPTQVSPEHVSPEHVSPEHVSPAKVGSREDPKLEGPGVDENVWVVDAPSIIFQQFHAIGMLTSPDGEPTNALFGFTRALLRLLRERKPDYLFCAFDFDGPTFRDELYDQYKAHREEMPDDLTPQIPLILELLELFDVPVLIRPGYEADDILATVARLCEEGQANCYLVTSDKDCRQLLSSRVRIFSNRKNQVFDEEALLADWGIRPDQAVDFQALTGDPVDNVPGVPLIGPTYARQYLQQYETLDAVLAAAVDMKPSKRRDNLLAFKDQALLSRELVTLDRYVPLEVDWQQGRPGNVDTMGAEAFFERMNFRGLADQMGRVNLASRETQWQAEYHCVDTPAKLQQLVEQLRRQRVIAVDTETTSLRPRDADLVGYSFAWTPGQAYYVPVRSPEGDAAIDPQVVAEALRPVLADPGIEKIGQNLKFDMVVLRSAGLAVRGVGFDTLVASYLREPGARSHSLDDLSRRFLRHSTIKLTELIGTGRKQITADQVPLSRMAEYAAEDADVTLRLRPVLAGRLDEELDKLLHEVELPLIEVLADLEYNGIFVDPQRLGELSSQYAEEITRLEGEIYHLAGHEFNINSPKQLQQVLFEELKLPVRKRIASGASTDVDVLRDLAGQHELPRKIIDYRQFAKLKNTYVDALPELISPRSGRVHASFNQHITATGRLSSSDPNLQNIPVRTEQGREIRSAFRPQLPGWRLLCADYSQIELRLLAHYSGDEALCTAFAEDQDIHALVASQVHKVPLAEVTTAMRRAAKTVNFGIIYGQSPFGLARKLGIDKEEAEQFITAYFRQYPGVDSFLTTTLAKAREEGYVKTILGRKRRVSGIRAFLGQSAIGRQRNQSEREAVNTVIQGSAADLIKQAMIAVYRQLQTGSPSHTTTHPDQSHQDRPWQARMLLQIHDELVFEAPNEEVDALAKLVVDEMTSVLQLNVPLKVDVSLGEDWLNTETWISKP